MTIKIKIGEPPQQTGPPQAQVRLEIRRSVDGNLLINDHEFIDIVIVPETRKIITMPKPYVERDTYEYQKSLMYALFKGGILGPEAPRSGARFGVMEAVYPTTDKVNPLQALLLQVEKYIRQTSADEMQAQEYDENIEDNFTDPPPDETTAWEQIPPYQDNPKAQRVNPNYTFAGYGYLY
jgi:hypothetical protein